jgi:hypothetical protein
MKSPTIERIIILILFILLIISLMMGSQNKNRFDFQVLRYEGSPPQILKFDKQEGRIYLIGRELDVSIEIGTRDSSFLKDKP